KKSDRRAQTTPRGNRKKNQIRGYCSGDVSSPRFGPRAEAAFGPARVGGSHTSPHAWAHRWNPFLVKKSPSPRQRGLAGVALITFN
ncbi:unnamed protein product, partial [Prunus brigantina]